MADDAARAGRRGRLGVSPGPVGYLTAWKWIRRALQERVAQTQEPERRNLPVEA